MRKLFAFLLCMLLICSAVAGEDKSSLATQNRLLKEELALAKTPSLYFIVYLESKTIALKSRGMILQEWKVESVQRWGDAPPLEAMLLEKKSALFPPKRTKIKPAKEEEEGTFELEALELKDMPSRFSLFLSQGLRIYIRPKPKKAISRLGNLGYFLSWNLWVPLKKLWHKARKKPFAAIALKLAGKEEAQALYWAFPDGIKGLVFPL